VGTRCTTHRAYPAFAAIVYDEARAPAGLERAGAEFCLEMQGGVVFPYIFMGV